MQGALETTVDNAIDEIAALLAAAYCRRAMSRLIHATPEPLQSTKPLITLAKRGLMN